MSQSSLYPESPRNVPSNLTEAKSSYKRQAWLAMVGLSLFMLIFIALMITFGYITFKGYSAFLNSEISFLGLILPFCSMMLTLFMAKSLFAVRKSGNTPGVEVFPEQEPEMYAFLHNLADEIGAPRPHRVFVTPEVNAAVFYDLSLLNLLFPSKKNLIIGLGLVNVLNLGELKAVLAHEFGHFAQGSMVVGRWVYTAQQIIAHMVSVRDWLDNLIQGISRIDLRIAWIGWILSIIIWSLRSIMDTLFNIVIIAERALSREMEFNADLVAVSVTGSDALVNALYKLQAADHAYQTAMEVVHSEASNGKMLEDIFQAQAAAIQEMRRVLDDKHYGTPPTRADGTEKATHRVFKGESARPPQMWSTHPPNSDRENNAKALYVPAEIDNRSAWELFSNPKDIKKQISLNIYNPDKISEMEATVPVEAVSRQFSNLSYSPEYRGAYLKRSPVRSFASIEQMIGMATVNGPAKEALSKIYPESISDELEALRNLQIERHTLEALMSGELKPSGGVIRHRGEDLDTADIPEAIENLGDEIQDAAEKLMAHDANCRKAHLIAGEEFSPEWKAYLHSLVSKLHFTEHLAAVVDNEHALLINTWNVITADGQIGYFEKKRMLRVCAQTQLTMHTVSEKLLELHLPESIRKDLGIENWKEQCPQFDLESATKKNWPDWVRAASESKSHISHVLNILKTSTLEELIRIEADLRHHITNGTKPDMAPELGHCPKDYPVLLPGDEHVLQKKLDLWNRFQLAHGLMPTIARLAVSMSIVGGTIYGGLFGIL